MAKRKHKKLIETHSGSYVGYWKSDIDRFLENFPATKRKWDTWTGARRGILVDGELLIEKSNWEEFLKQKDIFKDPE